MCKKFQLCSLINSFFPLSPLLLLVFLQHEHRNRLSVCNKLCYAIGGAPYQITGCALGFFLQIYLLDVAQVRKFTIPAACLDLSRPLQCYFYYTNLNIDNLTPLKEHLTYWIGTSRLCFPYSM